MPSLKRNVRAGLEVQHARYTAVYLDRDGKRVAVYHCTAKGEAWTHPYQGRKACATCQGRKGR